MNKTSSEVFRIKYDEIESGKYIFRIPRIADYVVILDSEAEIYLWDNSINPKELILHETTLNIAELYSSGYVIIVKKNNPENLKIKGIFLDQ